MSSRTKSVEAQAEKKKKKLAIIAGLPAGVNAYPGGGGGVRVRLGKRFTGGGVIRQRFQTVKAAREFIFGDEAKKLQARTPGAIDLKRDIGAAAFDVPRGVYSEAAAAWEELKKVKSPGGILDAVRFYIKHTNLKAGKWTIAEAGEALEKHLLRLKRDERYRKGLQWTFGRLEEDFPKSHIHEITKTEILDWLDEEDFEPLTRNNYIRDLKVLFNFAEREKRVSINPMKEIRREQVADSEVSILSIRDTARVLLTSMHVTGMQSPTAFKFFLGVRTSEVRRMDWSEIAEDMVIVAAKKAKTRARRTITITDNLREWLPEPCPKNGPLAPSGREWKNGFELLKTVSGVNPWPRNCQRHAFGSFHLAKHRNENLTATEMGNTPDIVIRHYRAVVRESKNIDKYWSLTPSNVREHAEMDEKFEAALERLK